jgi:ABC-type phosphate transport system substrate-binding protein
LALAIFVLAGAVLLGVKPFQPGNGNSQPTQPTPSESRSTAKPVTAACATGTLQLTGSTAFMPIAQAAAEAYSHDCTGATIDVSGRGSAYGLTAMQHAVASGSPSAGSMIAMYDGLPSATDTTGVRPYPAGVLIFSVVAHAGLFPQSNITAAELRKIFVKPGKQGVVAVGREADSGTREAFSANILKQDPSPQAPGKCPSPTGRAVSLTGCTENGNTGVLSFVNETPNAIGYAELYGPLAGYPKVSVISIDNAAPTLKNVRNGSYGFWVVEHLYAAVRPTALTKDFLDFLPHYIESHPPTGFIACSSAPRLEADC